MTARKQRGAILLLLALLVVVVGSSLLLAVPALLGPRPASNAADAAVLAQARELMLGYATANRSRPGELPFPDRNADGNYDDNGDCVSTWSTVLDAHLLGKWPARLEQGCGPAHRNALGLALHDASGQRLWYAVSRNLLFPSPALHSDLATSWLSVRARDGTVLANEVAFLLLAPGAPVAGQKRTLLADADAFLEPVAIGSVVHDNADGDLAFIDAAGSTTFNDRLAFVTRSEFFGLVTQRVAGELARTLEVYRVGFGTYPPAADEAGVCDTALSAGRFPEVAGGCAAVPAAPAPWFGTNWRTVTRYTRLSATRVELRFDGCAAIAYQLEAGHLTRNARVC